MGSIIPEAEHARFDPFTLPPLEYLGLVETICETTQQSYRRHLARFESCDDIAIIVVGSDGKKERHTQSKTEFVVIEEDEHDQDIAEELQRYLRRYTPLHLDAGPHNHIDTKRLWRDDPISFAFDDRHLVYPDRVLNASFIVGNPRVAELARLRVLQEMIGDNRTGKRIRGTIKDQLSEYREAIESGVSRRIPVFSPKDYLQWYDEKTPIRPGFKPAFLRAVQRKCDLLLIQTLLHRGLSIGDAVNLYPSETFDKFSFFADMGMIDQDQSENVGFAYTWFLREYHRVQELYKRRRMLVRLPFDPDEFSCFKEVILQFLAI